MLKNGMALLTEEVEEVDMILERVGESCSRGVRVGDGGDAFLGIVVTDGSKQGRGRREVGR